MAAGFEALRTFADLECWGKFSNSSILKSWKRACLAAKAPETRVYDLRPSFGTELAEWLNGPGTSRPLRNC
jgi:hypothetical protein